MLFHRPKAVDENAELSVVTVSHEHETPKTDCMPPQQYRRSVVRQWGVGEGTALGSAVFWCHGKAELATEEHVVDRRGECLDPTLDQGNVVLLNAPHLKNFTGSL